jgi:uncharacterized membrane protein YhaH (DUF805 family)
VAGRRTENAPRACLGALLSRGNDHSVRIVKIGVGTTAMSFFEAIASGLHNYLNFAGRATRAEYWYWTLPVGIINIVLGVADERLNPGTSFGALSWVAMIVFLATVLPTLAVSIRRLHDIDRNGWWILLWLTAIGGLVLIYWACRPGAPGPNRFGPPNPNLAPSGAQQPAL